MNLQVILQGFTLLHIMVEGKFSFKMKHVYENNLEGGGARSTSKQNDR